MGPVAICFGVLLIALGLVGFIPSHQPTALIPAGMGVIFVVLGYLARQDRLRKHVMHGAAALALLGLIAGLWRVIAGLSKDEPSTLAVTVNALLAAGCAAFVGLCVKSFIDARRRRKANSTAQGS